MMKQLAAVLAVTAGCATAEVEGVFQLEGRVVGASNVTHVVAADPDSATRVVVDVAVDGRFELALEVGTAWVVTFTDWTKVGMDMQVATLQANGLDAFVPQLPGSLDLGDVKMVSARAHGTVEYGTLLAALGIDHETATRMGRTDNLALRYANPDIDNDGTIDAFQHGHEYRLDISGSFTLATAGGAATIADLTAGLPDAARIQYRGTTIRAVVPRAMNMNMASGTLTFEQPFFGTALGGITPAIEPGTPVGAPHVKHGELAGMPMIGVVARGAEDAPSGTYELGFDNGQLTFSDVHTPNAAALAAGEGFAVPFVRIRPVEPTCTVDCDIAAVDIEWRRQTAFGWQVTDEPSSVRLAMVVSLHGKNTYLGTTLETGTTSLAWAAMPVGGSGLVPSELAYVQTSEICYLEVGYASELGMPMTMSVANPGCR